jgi:hypothetical protein
VLGTVSYRVVKKSLREVLHTRFHQVINLNALFMKDLYVSMGACVHNRGRSSHVTWAPLISNKLSEKYLGA